MKRILKALAEANIFLDDKFEPFVPDGKFRVHNELFFYCGFQDFEDRTGEPFYTVLYGAFGEDAKEYSTNENPTYIDQLKIKKRFERAYKLLRDTQPEPPAEPKPTGWFVQALGFKEKDFFYTSSSNRQIVAMRAFTESEMLALMPIEYWETVFPNSKKGVDWTVAKSKMMDDARRAGIFQARHVRGAGVWNDEGRVVVNMGDHLVVDGVRVELGKLGSRYFYTLGNALSPLHDRPLAASECDTLVDACSEFKWVKPDYSFLMAGALVVGRVCGALPVRPHTWITGSASTGKTTLLEKLIQPILGDSVLYVQGATTEAGIRQSLRADAIPVVFDEFETTGQKSQENVNAVVELLRSAWSDSNAMVVKGGANGNATAYQIRCSAIVSSIRTKLANDADLQRFARVELRPHGSDPHHWVRLSSLLAQIDREYGERLFARTIKMIPVLLANFKTIKRALALRAGARFGDQYGMLFAGYSILLQDEPMTDADAKMLLDAVNLVDEKEQSKIADHEDCLDKILTKKVPIEVRGERRDFVISEAILAARVEPEINAALQRIGIAVLMKDYSVAIATMHTELEAQIFKGSKWSETWGNSLARLPGAEKNRSVWMAGRNKKCIVLPPALFPSS